MRPRARKGKNPVVLRFEQLGIQLIPPLYRATRTAISLALRHQAHHDARCSCLPTPPLAPHHPSHHVPATFAATASSGSLGLLLSPPSISPACPPACTPGRTAAGEDAAHGASPPFVSTCTEHAFVASLVRAGPAPSISFSTAHPKGRATSFHRSRIPRCMRARRWRAACWSCFAGMRCAQVKIAPAAPICMVLQCATDTHHAADNSTSSWTQGKIGGSTHRAWRSGAPDS